MTKVKTFKDFRGNDVYVRENGTRDVSISFIGDPGYTEQSHKEATDIKHIIAQYVRSGTFVAMPPSEYRDYTNLPDYQTALNTIKSIDDLFMSLPVEVRQTYDHSPVLFMDALNDPKQKKKLIELGILMAPVAQSGAPMKTNSTKEGVSSSDLTREAGETP